jgi:L-fuculose-phosphate aldolase
MDEATARRALVDAVRRLDAAGLNHNSSGNASVRVGSALLVTPSGIPAGRLDVTDPVLVDHDGRPLRAGQRVPTSEWRLHVRVLASRPDVAAIAHTHSPEATAAAALGDDLPAIHYVVARFGGRTLACAPYATYGSAELAEHVVRTLGPRRSACLMANHGALAVAADLDTAVELAIDVEWFCGVTRRARALGEPTVLPGEEVDRVAARLATYGQPSTAVVPPPSGGRVNP